MQGSFPQSAKKAEKEITDLFSPRQDITQNDSGRRHVSEKNNYAMQAR